MNKVIFPIVEGSEGNVVTDLQDALQVCLGRLSLSYSLKKERSQQLYGEVTNQLVSRFQEEQGIDPVGYVDEPTANALNELLRQWGLLDNQEAQRVHVVTGSVRRSDGSVLSGLQVRASHQAESGAIRLGEDITDSAGRYTIRYESLPGLAAVNLFVAVFNEEDGLIQSSDILYNVSGLQTIDIVIQILRHVKGTVFWENGLPAEGLRLRLYQHQFGGIKKQIKSDITTAQTTGGYSFSYVPDGTEPVMEVRAVVGSREISLTKPLHGLTEEELLNLNLVAPAAAKPAGPSEYSRLASDLGKIITPENRRDISRLASAKENAEQQDITLLHSKTGWDARLIALASLTEQLAADQEMKLPSEGLYGLLRAGLSSDKLLLAQIEPETVGEVLKKVTAAGIVSLDDNAIASFKKQFAEFSKQTRLNLTMPGSASTYGELLQSSGLTKNDQDKFAEVLFRQGDDGNGLKLWEESKKAGLGEAQISRLQMQGKCSFLAASSAAVTKRLLDKKIHNLDELIQQDFHRAETWKQEIFSAAAIPPNRWKNLTDDDRDKLKTVIPAAFMGKDAEARLELYAEDMARKIRLSYPTQTIARLMESDESFKTLTGDGNATLTLLKNAAAQGFRLGETPITAFLEKEKKNVDVRGNLSHAEFQAAGQQLKTLQRLYQITPDNESMPVLMKMGITAAADVTAFPQELFIARYSAIYLNIYKKNPIVSIAKLIYNKSRQVSSVTRNLFAVASQLNSTPALAGTRTASAVTNGQIRDELADTKKELIKRYPTLEKLFGSMDYCECEHCRSVLSPAAYFVDLLQFIDMNEEPWANFLAKWKADHGGQEYPYKDSSGKPLKPYDVLLERRPDLPHIALTCENTHTALPHIDVVNEILEYYVANEKLEEDTAQDTGNAVAAELLAEPQNVIGKAYENLTEASYPLNLPFDRWIETVRSFCGYFEMPLHRLLEVFRPTDALFDSSTSYDRATIFMESFGLSPSEVKFFTDPKQLDTWHELYGFTSAAEATTEARNSETGQRIDLHSARTLSRRLGVTYKDLTEIVQTGFVNPELQKLVLLYKLRISIADARKNIEGLEQRIQDLAKEFKTSEDELRTAIATMPFDKVLVFADTDAGCNFDLTLLQYADGIRKAQPLDFLRINLFVRLWRKLGWSIEETDRALTAFIPAVALTDASQFPDWFKTALICLAHLKTLEEKVNVGKNSRIKILTLWTDMPATGKNSLYAQLFLAKSVLKSTPVFDHPLGHYLSDANIKIKEHLPALQGALGLAVDDIAAILADAGKSTDYALSLSNVSLLYRYGLLAKGLKLSVHNLIALKQLSGLDPFKKLHSEPPQPLQSLNEDYPFTQTIAFVEIAEAVQNSGLELEELDYLLRHRDPAGQHSPNRETTLALLKTLAEGISAIRAEHAVPDDSSALSSEVLRQKLGLVLPPDVMNTFLSMLNGTAEYTAVKSGVAQADSLPPAAFADQSSVREVKYKDVPNEQRLTFRGVLSSDAQKDKLRGATVTPSWTAGQQIVLSDLLNDVQTQAKTFFDAHLRKQSSSQPESGFLENADYDLLFAPAPDDLTEQEEQQRQRHNRLIQTFLPFLQNRLTRQFIVQTLVAQTGADPVLVESFITDDRLLKAGDKSMLAALTAVAERGVSAAFYSSADLSGPQQADLTMTTADTLLNTANSARFTGYLEVVTSGAYRFFVELEKKDAQAELCFIHLPQPVFLSGTANGSNATTLTNFLELKAGLPYHFTLEVKNLNGGQARLLVQGETLPKGPLSQLKLYPAENWNAAEKALLLLAKSLRFVQGLGLSEREIRYLLTHAGDFDNVILSELPTVADDNAVQRFKQFLRLTKYTQLKREMAGGTETDELISIFEANGAKMIDKVYQLIAKVTRQSKETVKSAADVLFSSDPAFASEQPLAKLWQVLQLVQRFGVAPAALKEWTEIVSPAVSAQKRFDITLNVRDTIKAHCEEEVWLRVAQPIFDKLRQKSRDALVAHVMHKHNFERMEQLYEYFLVDPGMEPVVQTSRIRLAISSVQLFIQRCLMNLEPKVKPSVINSKQWEWMKRYRVWEANRKIFLFPENWLEPEFRDDKTHLFKELEGALLQGDVSKDLVEDAFFNYLKKLDELARLDMVAMHIENNTNPAQRVLHVFGRTYSQPHKYFYRRYKNQSWTPWEPVSAQVEGDHLAPVVWRDRLYLFWVTFLDKPQSNQTPSGVNASKQLTALSLSDTVNAMSTMIANKIVEVHLHWSEYVNGEWSTRESGGLSPIISSEVPTSFHPTSVFIHVSKEHDENGEERGVFIHLGGGDFQQQAFYLASRNSQPEKRRYSDKPANPFPASEKLVVNFSKRKVNTEAFSIILDHGNYYTLLQCNNNLLTLGISAESYRNAVDPDKVKEAIEKGLDELATLMKPIFYQDNMNTFFVEPSVEEETIEKWDGWAVAIDNDPMPKRDLPTEVMVIPEIPRKDLLINPIELQVNPAAAVQPVLRHDALINPNTVLKFGDVLIGPAGQAGLEVTGGLAAQASLAGHVNVNSASEVSGSVVVSAEHTFTRSGLALAEGGLNVVGASGLNAALKQNVTKLNR